jgi:hypothetical protein
MASIFSVYFREGRPPCRPIFFFFYLGPNDQSDGTDVSAEVRPLPDEGGGRPSMKNETSAKMPGACARIIFGSKNFAQMSK